MMLRLTINEMFDMIGLNNSKAMISGNPRAIFNEIVLQINLRD